MGCEVRTLTTSPMRWELTNDARRSAVLLDKNKKIVVTLVSKPQQDPTWDTVAVNGFQEAMNRLEQDLEFGDGLVVPPPHDSGSNPNGHANRRGSFRQATAGISFGGSQKVRFVMWSAGLARVYLSNCRNQFK